MDTLISDLKHTIRMLRRTPGFTVTAIAALALGIGANTAIFSVVNAVLLKPLPYPDPDRIVQLMGVSAQGSFAAASVPLYNVWRAQTQILQDVAAYDTGGPGINIVGGDRPEQVKGIHVSHEFFRLFGVPITLGRAFTADEDRLRGPNVVVDLRRPLASPLWRRSWTLLASRFRWAAKRTPFSASWARAFLSIPLPTCCCPFRPIRIAPSRCFTFRLRGA